MMHPQDPSDFDALLKYLSPTFKRRAYKLRRWTSNAIGEDDLMQEARFGAWNAWGRHYDSGIPILQLISIMAMRGKGAMLDIMDKTNWTGKHRGNKLTFPNLVSLEEMETPVEPVSHEGPDHLLYAKQMVNLLVKSCRPYRAYDNTQRNKHHLDVLQLIAQGFAVTEISETLSLSRFRVERILSEIRRKAEYMP